MNSRALAWLIGLSTLTSGLAACGDSTTTRSEGNPSTPGDGDGDGDSGDGDSGDGDSGDGDSGDGDSGDGDTGDGDGDGGTGDGDGDTGNGELPKGMPDDNDWNWVSMANTTCRDGSPAGYFYRKGTENSLLIYLNGGGACADKFFCNLNPTNVNYDFPIESLIHGLPELLVGINGAENLSLRGKQKAPEEGIFKRADASNPAAKWSMIYVPYCTGDIHAGTRKDVMIEGIDGPQQFTGRLNYEKFLDSFGPTFKNSDKVLLTGSSAGGFGTLFNADYTIEWFKKRGNAKVYAISDSGVPFQDDFMAACLQKRWRETWGLDAILPKDCADCFQADGGGIVTGYGKYLFHEKYKGRMLGGMISSVGDEIIRAFYAPGENNCTVDPMSNTVEQAIANGGAYSVDKFTKGLQDVLTNVVKRGTVGFYTLEGGKHMHLWRSEFYDKNTNDLTIAEWISKLLADEANEQGHLFAPAP
ncbi:MAG: pectin acetylesterase-family hydrolase [Myxococcales bacterium]